MTVHVFGAVLSSTSCIYALQPTAAERVLNNIYVDNYLEAGDTEEEPIIHRQEVTDLHTLGGFNIMQWMSSSRPVLVYV